MDYPNRKRIKIWGIARYVEDDAVLLDRLVDPDYGAQPQRAIVFSVRAWDLNCPQHITPRYTIEDLSAVTAEGARSGGSRDRGRRHGYAGRDDVARSLDGGSHAGRYHVDDDRAGGRADVSCSFGAALASVSTTRRALTPRIRCAGPTTWGQLRVPYPQAFFSRGLDGRIDDPNAGWKGRGVWATFGAAVTWHIEGGQGAKPGIIKFQVRPDPLAN